MDTRYSRCNHWGRNNNYIGKRTASITMNIARDKKGHFIKGFSHNKGIVRSEEYKRKMRLIKTGFKHSEETKNKMSLSGKGKKKPKRSPQHCQKISELHKGRKASIETKAKMSNAQKAEKSHLWKGGISPIHNTIRRSLEYRLWRTAVFERDKYTCIWCGDDRGGNLNADHIKPFAHYPELRFAIDNGRTLCVECHKKTDTWGSKSKK